MEKSLVSVLLLLVAVSCTLAKDDTTTAKNGRKDKKEAKDTHPKLPQTLSRGWGDQLFWTQTYEEALFKAKNNNKPIMVIHHLEDCPHSQALKKAFAEHKEIQKLAEKFILLNLVYETTDKNLSPDGQYVPRIVFVGCIFNMEKSGFANIQTLECDCWQNLNLLYCWFYPSLTVRADITGRYANRLYAYEPNDIPLLHSNMQKAQKLLKTEL